MKKSKQTSININYAGLTDIGKERTKNQDSYGQFPENTFDSLTPGGLMFVVADGMGGHEMGEEASRMAVEILSREYYESQESNIDQSLVHSVQKANSAIFEKATATSEKHQMGTTLSALVLTGNTAHIVHVGDSRIYLARDGKLIQLTTDHTKVEELKRAGIINKEEAKSHPERSVLQRALGVKEQVRVDISGDLQIKPNDTFILCTDGLARIKKDELIDIALKETPGVTCQKLIDLANERGGIDNSTVQIIKIEKSSVEKIQAKQQIRPVVMGLGILAVILIIATIYISIQYGNTKSQTSAIDISSLEEDSREIKNLFRNARKYVNQSRFDEAILAYQQILIINPLENAALEEIDQIAARLIEIGKQHQIRGDLDKALVSFRSAFEIRPQDKELADLIKSIE
jgi:protein phosphatase